MTYTPIETNRVGRPAGGSGLFRPFELIFEFVSGFVEGYRGRRELLRLSQSSDYLLADIGISRSDVEWALMQPWDRDPSLALADRVNSRKKAGRWAHGFQVGFDRT